MALTATLQKYLPPTSPEALGRCRVLFFSWCLLQLMWYRPTEYALLPTEFWDPPLLLRFFSPPSPTQLNLAAGLLMGLLIMAALGFRSRFSVPSAAILLTYVFGVANSYGETGFHQSPLIVIAWLLACSPCGDAFSWDARGRGECSSKSVEYQWPIQASRIILVTFMFTGGLHKLFGTWLLQPAQSLEMVLLVKAYPQALDKGLEFPYLLEMGPWGTILAVLACLTLCLELFSPLALSERWPRLRFVLIGGLFLMQLSLATMQTLTSFPWLGAYFFWLPWGDQS